MGVLFTILLIILFIYYVLPRILPWLIAFLGNKMLNRFKKDMEEGQQTFEDKRIARSREDTTEVNVADAVVDPMLDMDRLLATMKESMWISRKFRNNKNVGMDIPKTKNKKDRF